MPLPNGLARTPPKLTPNRVSAQRSHEPPRAQSLIHLRDSHVWAGNFGWAHWASSGFGIGPQLTGHLGRVAVFSGEIKKRSWNVDDNKRLLFFESPQSWNVYENKQVIEKSWNVDDK